MKITHDLSSLEWKLMGTIPFNWAYAMLDKNLTPCYEVAPVSARVPGSVQQALLDAGLVDNWLIADNAKKMEWVENRHWIYSATIPAEWFMQGTDAVLHCDGLDYCGWIYFNYQKVGSFKGTNIPHSFSLQCDKEHQGDSVLHIIFDLPPRWLGMIGYTNEIREWKTRFNYTWDWMPRLVQTGIWSDIRLEISQGGYIKEFNCWTDADWQRETGEVHIKGRLGGNVSNGAVQCKLMYQNDEIDTFCMTSDGYQRGMEFKDFPVKLWWPNLEGEQPLYHITVQLLDAEGKVLDTVTRRIGFKNIVWQPTKDMPEGAYPWICVVNGRSIFMQGVNFQPIRGNFADLTRVDYVKRLWQYKEMGANTFRINGCGYIETSDFYELCDEYGFLVWQDLTLSSSSINNTPPSDPQSMLEMGEVFRHAIYRRQHHVSLFMWSGGNELSRRIDPKNLHEFGNPCTLEDPMLAMFANMAAELDPGHRYVETSPTGPSIILFDEQIGKGLHHDIHGPYSAFETDESANVYWSHDDSLLRSEMACAGPQPAEMTRKYAGSWQVMPATADNPLWRYPFYVWVDWEFIVRKLGREPESLEEYVRLSQEKQAHALELGMAACKKRFPECGGVLLWGSHDSFPNPINTTILDFDGEPKPAAFALKRIWRTPLSQRDNL